MLSVIMWATGISLAFIGGAYGLISTKFSGVNTNIINHEGRISAIEARSERIPIIESKLDVLLLKQGVKFGEIQTNLATTTRYDGQ